MSEVVYNRRQKTYDCFERSFDDKDQARWYRVMQLKRSVGLLAESLVWSYPELEDLLLKAAEYAAEERVFVFPVRLDDMVVAEVQGEKFYYLRRFDNGVWRCDCPAQTWSEASDLPGLPEQERRVCKHMLAVWLVEWEQWGRRIFEG